MEGSANSKNVSNYEMLAQYYDEPLNKASSDVDIKIRPEDVEVCNRILKENNYKTKIILQIHDELIFKVPKEEKDFIPKILKNIMENCVDNLDVKLEVDGSLAKTWYECK